MIDPIAASVPVFLALIAAEAVVLHRRGGPVLRVNDALTDIGCGVGNQVLAVWAGLALLAPYTWLYEAAPVQLSADKPLTWLLAIVLQDLGYWVYHWASHRSNLFWATHVVHHQSEDYNLAVALRQSWFSQFTGWIFYLPLALVGVPPLVFAIASALNLLYQFWIHTEAIGRLGPLEWVFNTPSHHRVHHGVDPIYVDRNYAGIFIVWDRLFGTFQEERHPPRYGVHHPVRTWNSLWANVAPLIDLGRAVAAAEGLSEKLSALFGPPGGRAEPPAGPARLAWYEARLAESLPARGYDPHPGAALQGWLLVQLVALGLATGLLRLLYLDGQRLAVVAFSGGLLWGVANWGGLVEGRRWARPSELARLVLCGGAASAALAEGGGGPLLSTTILAVLLGYCCLSAASLAPASAARSPSAV